MHKLKKGVLAAAAVIALACISMTGCGRAVTPAPADVNSEVARSVYEKSCVEADWDSLVNEKKKNKGSKVKAELTVITVDKNQILAESEDGDLYLLIDQREGAEKASEDDKLVVYADYEGTVKVSDMDLPKLIMKYSVNAEESSVVNEAAAEAVAEASAETDEAAVEEVVQQPAQKKSGYSVHVAQYDFTDYPRVRMYLEVRDGNGNAVKNLAPNMFQVSERDAASGNFLMRTVEKAVVINENEGLNINMVADTSGSMRDNKIEDAKYIMNNFVDTVQFSAGDSVRLVPFNSYIDKSNGYTSDAFQLKNTINSFYADGLTKLYDTLIYSVQDVSGQNGAKCVIAFTDGYDEGSCNTASDVVDVVSRYDIPVFIVKIGNDGAEYDVDLQRIADVSGGSFRNFYEFNADMQSFYSQVYRQMKEYYLVEYAADSAADVNSSKEISVYVENGDLGGESIESVTPGRDMFDSLLGAYLRSYTMDMNNHYYDHLKEYVDPNVAEDDKWSIQWQMKKQVSGGFDNVYAEDIMSYQITGIEVMDEKTVHLWATEDYDTVYDEIYGDMLAGRKSINKSQLQYINSMGYSNGSFDPASHVRIWARIRQYPEYILKRGYDGRWRFSKYTGDLSLRPETRFYDFEVH